MKRIFALLFALCISQLLLLNEVQAQCAKPVVIADDAVVCAGGTTVLHAELGSGATYTWSTGSANTYYITVSAGTYTLTATYPGGCLATSDPVVIKEKSMAAVTPSAAPALCSGQSITLYADTGNVWKRNGDIAAAIRVCGVSFSIGTKGYVGCGYWGSFLSDFWEYDEINDTWSQKADVPGTGGRGYPIGFALNYMGYVGLGQNSSIYMADFYMFNPYENTWTPKASYPPGATSAAVAFTSRNYGYVGLGTRGGHPNTFYAYDPSVDSWAPIANFPGTGRREAIGFTLNYKGYVACGWANGATNVNDCWEYDASTGQWNAMPSLPGLPRRTMSAFTIKDHGYLNCGFADGVGSLNELWEFYNGRWTRKTNFPAGGQWGPFSFGFSDKGVAVFGTNGNKQVYAYYPNNTVRWPNGSTSTSYTVNTAGSYSATITDMAGCSYTTDPLTVTTNSVSASITSTTTTTICEGVKDTLWANGDSWTKKQNLPFATRWATGFALGANGYYMGGTINAYQLWKYDAATDTWSQQANTPTYTVITPAVAWHGKAWLVGSNDKHTWMYDPAYNGWTRKADFPGSAVNVVPGFLLNDHLYVTGGGTGSSNYTAEVWSYDLLNDAWTRKNDMPYTVSYTQAFALNGKGYICTGNSSRDGAAFPQSALFMEYDPGTDTWTSLPDFPGGPRGGAVAFTDGHNKAYVGLGNNGPQKKDLWQFDATSKTWTQMQGVPFSDAGINFVLGHYAYLTATSPTGGNDNVWQYEMPYSYLWSTGATTRYLEVTQTGDYSVAVNNEEGCSATSSAIHITVQPKTVITAPPADTTVCDGLAAGFSLGATGTNLTYQWQLNSSNVADGGVYSGATTTALHVSNVNGLNAAQYKCVVTGTCGTLTTPAVTLTVNLLPAKPVIAAGGPVTFCNGGDVTLSSSSTAGNAWSNSATTQNINIGTPGTFTVKVTDANGCVSPVSDAVIVTVNPLPAKPAVTASGATTFCEGGSVSLGGGSAANYTWSNGSTTQKIVVTQSGSYSLTVTDANGCESPVSDAVAITVNPLPTQPVITASGPLHFCDGNSVQLTSSAANAYLWSTGSSNGFINITRSGSYTVRVTDANGCTSPASDATVVQVNPLPSGSIFQQGPMLMNNTHYMQLTAPYMSGAQYAWSTGDQAQVIKALQSGDYSVLVTSAAGCKQKFYITIQLVDLTKVPNTFSPNHDGVNDYWYIKALDAFPNASIMIFNRNGSKVFEAKGTGIKWDGTSNGHELPAGVYYYVIDLKDGSSAINGWINLVR